MPAPGIFSLLQLASSTPRGMVKVHGFLFAHTDNLQVDKGLGGLLAALVCCSEMPKRSSGA